MDTLTQLTQVTFWNKKACCCKETARCRSCSFRLAWPSMSLNFDFGTNWKGVWDFLLVTHINFGPILLRFRNSACFLVRRATPPLFYQNFGVPLGLDCRCFGSEVRRPKIMSRVIIFELTQHIRYTVHQRQRWTDGRTETDGRLTTAIPCFTLRASRGNEMICFLELQEAQLPHRNRA